MSAEHSGVRTKYRPLDAVGHHVGPLVTQQAERKQEELEEKRFLRRLNMPPLPASFALCVCQKTFRQNWSKPPYFPGADESQPQKN